MRMFLSFKAAPRSNALANPAALPAVSREIYLVAAGKGPDFFLLPGVLRSALLICVINFSKLDGTSYIAVGDLVPSEVRG
jgi:hypothetical protein